MKTPRLATRPVALRVMLAATFLAASAVPVFAQDEAAPDTSSA